MITSDWNWDHRIRNVLLVRLRRIGDAVLITPCLSALKSWRPDIQIDVVLDAASAPVLKNHPLVRSVIEAPVASGFRSALTKRRTIRRLRAGKYDLAVNLHGGTTSMILTWLSGARTTASLAKQPGARLMSLRVPDPQEVWGRDNLHTVENQLALFKWLGVPMPCPLPATTLVADCVADAALRARVPADIVGDRYAVVHPAASCRGKEWEPARFAEVVGFLRERYGLPSVVIGTPSERNQVESVVRQAPTHSVALYDAPLAEVIALIGRSAIFVGVDSGPAHIAAAMAIPSVVIFVYPVSVTPWRPWTRAPHRVVIAGRRDERLCPNGTCDPCLYPACASQITVEKVRTAVSAALAEAQAGVSGPGPQSPAHVGGTQQ